MQANRFVMQLCFHGVEVPEGLDAGLKQTNQQLLHARTGLGTLHLLSNANLLSHGFRYLRLLRQITWINTPEGLWRNLDCEDEYSLREHDQQ